LIQRAFLCWCLALAGCAATTGKQPAPVPYRATIAIKFDAYRVLSVKTSGFADPFARRAVTAHDPVRIASVSKLVTALGVMRLVETGALDLDRDVSDYLGWRLRNPAFPDAPITLRFLLSHRSSLIDNGEAYIVPLGDALQARLTGAEAWDADHPPGHYFRYANVNFPVIGSVMEAATGERFDRLMTRLVFAPLKLDACFNWTMCSDAAVARAVVLTDGAGAVLRDNLTGVRPDCPVATKQGGNCDLSTYRIGTNGALFSPQGGLRISMHSLARIGQMMMKGGQGFLKPKTIAAMIEPGATIMPETGDRENGFFCSYGLAVQSLATKAGGCRDDPFGDGKRRYGHAGEAYGLKSGLWLDGTHGVAFFVTAVSDEAPRGRSSFYAVEEDVLRR
jgi:CubicO group peptidase (beta-lactamase class C family)